MSGNGRLPATSLAPIAGGQLAQESALTWLAMRASAAADGVAPQLLQPGGPDSSYRTYERQVFWKDYWTAAGQPQKAATPGTSNHGLGNAVDCPYPVAQAWLLRHGPKWGWTHDEGLRVGEAWHFTYVGAPAWLVRKLTDPLAAYTASEQRWIHEYDHLRRTGTDTARQAVLRAVMKEQRKRIWRIAQPRSNGGDGKGWTRLRARRYRSLQKRTT